jgi:cytochrome c551/c552
VAQAAESQQLAAGPAGATAQRALLDRYCVTCHNERTKAANLSLQDLDLETVGDTPELWESVVRKLRAGMMPPPARAGRL